MSRPKPPTGTPADPRKTLIPAAAWTSSGTRCHFTLATRQVAKVSGLPHLVVKMAAAGLYVSLQKRTDKRHLLTAVVDTLTMRGTIDSAVRTLLGLRESSEQARTRTADLLDDSQSHDDYKTYLAVAYALYPELSPTQDVLALWTVKARGVVWMADTRTAYVAHDWQRQPVGGRWWIDLAVFLHTGNWAHLPSALTPHEITEAATAVRDQTLNIVEVCADGANHHPRLVTFEQLWCACHAGHERTTLTNSEKE